jgi:hypothetical protein
MKLLYAVAGYTHTDHQRRAEIRKNIKGFYLTSKYTYIRLQENLAAAFTQREAIGYINGPSTGKE